MAPSQGVPKRRLNVPDPGRVVGSRNYIKLAVCELRFPIVLEAEPRLPSILQKRLKHAYPRYEATKTITVTSVSPDASEAAPSTELDTRHVFRTRDKGWSFSVGQSSIALETSTYTEWAEFERRLSQILVHASELIESPFYTRIGLRYVNLISSTLYGNELDKWINPALCRPLADHVYGDVEQCVQVVRGWSDNGRYSLRHGLAPGAEESYLVDIDSFCEDDVVETDSVLELVRSLNRVAFRLFHWCLGPAAREHATIEPSRDYAR